MSRHAVFLLTALGLVCPSLSLAAGADDLKPLLSEPIVGKTLPLVEVQRFCESRVAPMPPVTTVQAWEKEADRLRAAVLERVVYCGETARWRDAPVKVEWLETIEGGPGYRIKKLRYEAVPGLWIPALLYEPEKLEGKVPVVLNVNGHVGAVGKAYIAKQHRCINQAKRGMLALNVEWIGMGQLSGGGYSHARMNQLDLCGTSGVGLHYLAMKRALDILLALEHADPARVAVTGLSGGGWQTIFFSSLETRVTLANPVAGYSSFRTRAMNLSDLGDSEQTPNDLASIADYCHLTAMLAPRPALLTKNSKDDCCFAAGHALPPLMEAAGPIYKLYGRPEALRSHVNDVPGTHNYEVDNRQAFYRMMGDFFYAGRPFDPKEIPSDKEIKSKEQLDIPLPSPNADFHSLALTLSQSLPRDAELPKDREAAARWQAERRARLQNIVRARDYRVQPIELKKDQKAGVRAVFWKLQMDQAWTVPAVELVQGEPKQTVVLVADDGRSSTADAAAKLLAAGNRVIAIDPFYFGESRLPSHDYLFALLVASVGDRPLGVQASQTAAVARWANEKFHCPVRVVAIGPRSSLFALVAAAIEEKAIAAVDLRQSMKSLKEIVEKNLGVSDRPEQFCFGLLEAFDIQQIAALVAPRHVSFDGCLMDLPGLPKWYQLFDGPR